MALATYNATLEYSPHVIEFVLTDADGEPENFDGTTKMYIERADGSGLSVSFNSLVTDNKIVISVDLDDTTKKATLCNESDRVFDYENQRPEHIWSLKSSTRTYISGTMKLLEVAG